MVGGAADRWPCPILVYIFYAVALFSCVALFGSPLYSLKRLLYFTISISTFMFSA